MSNSTSSMKKIQKKIDKLGTAKTLAKRAKLNEKVKKLIDEEEKVLKDYLEKLENINKDVPQVNNDDGDDNGSTDDNESDDNESDNNESDNNESDNNESDDNESDDNESDDNESTDKPDDDKSKDNESKDIVKNVDAYKLNKEIQDLTTKIDDCDDIEGRIKYYEQLHKKIALCKMYYNNMKIEIKNLN